MPSDWEGTVRPEISPFRPGKRTLKHVKRLFPLNVASNVSRRLVVRTKNGPQDQSGMKFHSFQHLWPRHHASHQNVSKTIELEERSRIVDNDIYNFIHFRKVDIIITEDHRRSNQEPLLLHLLLISSRTSRTENEKKNNEKLSKCSPHTVPST